MSLKLPRRWATPKVGKTSTLRHLCADEFEETLTYSQKESEGRLSSCASGSSNYKGNRRKSITITNPMRDSGDMKQPESPGSKDMQFMETFHSKYLSKLQISGHETITAIAISRCGKKFAFGTLKKVSRWTTMKFAKPTKKLMEMGQSSFSAVRRGIERDQNSENKSIYKIAKLMEKDERFPLFFVTLGEVEGKEVFNKDTDVERIHVHYHRVSGIEFNEDGTQMATCDMNGDVRIFNTTSKTPEQIGIHSHNGTRLTCISYAFNRRRNVQCLACGSEAPESRVYFYEVSRTPSDDILTSSEGDLKEDPDGLNFMIGHTLRRRDQVTAVLLMDDHRSSNRGGTLLAVGGHDRNVSIYAVLQGDDHRPSLRRGLGQSVFNFARRPSVDGRASDAAPAMGSCIYKLDLAVKIESMSCSDDGKTLVLGGGNQATVLRYNTFQFPSDGDGVVDGMKRYVKMLTGTILKPSKQTNLKEFSDWEEVCEVTSEGQVHSVSISGNGKHFLVGSFDKTAKLYHVKTGALLQQLQRPNRVSRVALSRTGQFGIVGAFDAKVIRYNMEGGLEPHCYIQQSRSKIVQSVDISGNGLSILMCSLGEISVYDLKTSSLKNRTERRDSTGRAVVVYSGELSHYGDYCFCGGYDNLVIGYHLLSDSEDCDEILRIETNGFVWGLALHEDMYRPCGDFSERWCMLAVGSWDKTATTYDIHGDAKNLVVTKTNEFLHGDRVFSTDISSDGRYLAVGTRDKKALVYDLHGYDQEKCITFKRNERVYCVSLSHDTSMLAVGDVENYVTVYDLATLKEINSWQRGGKIHDVEWSPNDRILAAGGEDQKVVLYDLEKNRILLQLPLEGVCWDLSMCSDSGALVCSSGDQVVMYGEPEHGYGMQDRPSFQMTEAFLYQKEALKIAVQSHPTIVNTMCPNTRKTLLQIAVEKNLIDQAVIILSGGSVPCALLNDANGHTAMYVAVRNKRKQMIHLLFDGISHGHIINSPATFEILYDYVKRPRRHPVTLFEDIGKYFPDILLTFLENCSSEHCHDRVLGSLNQAPITHTIFIGLPMHSPRNFWEKYFSMEKEKKMRLEKMESERKPTKSAIFDLERLNNSLEFEHASSADDDDVELAVEALRLPIPGICQKFRVRNEDQVLDADSRAGSDSRFFKFRTQCEACGEFGRFRWVGQAFRCCGRLFGQLRCFGQVHDPEFRNNSPLNVVVKAANKMKDYSVFKDGTITARVIQYKWATIKSYFQAQCYAYIMYLVMICLFANGVANTIEYDLDELWQDFWGKCSLLLVGPSLWCSCCYLFQEFEQFKFAAEGRIREKRWRVFLRMIFAHFGSVWNVVDVFAFMLQAVVCVLFLLRYRLTRQVASVAIILQFFKILFYARGWDDWGPLVRIVDRTFVSMIPFLGVVIIVIFGFAMAFKVLEVEFEEFETFPMSMLQTSLLVYGNFNGFNEILTPAGIRENYITIAFIMWFMLIIVVILLNLLIAIMNDTYAEVSTNATLEHRMQLANIILEIENGSSFSRTDTKLFPRWVHILKPICTLEPDDKSHWQYAIEKLLHQGIENEKRFDEIESKLKETLKQIHKVQAMQIKYDNETSAGPGPM